MPGMAVTIDDEAILEFWQSHSPQEQAGDFRLFRSVLFAFVAFVRAIQAAEQRVAMEGALPLGQARDDGEIDPGELESLIETYEEWASPMTALAEHPADRIKFLTERERSDLSTLLQCGPLSQHFPLSILRTDTFGTHQSRIVRALRSPSANLEWLLGCDEVRSYTEQISKYQALRDHVQKTLEAAALVLLQAGDEAAGAGKSVTFGS